MLALIVFTLLKLIVNGVLFCVVRLTHFWRFLSCKEMACSLWYIELMWPITHLTLGKFIVHVLEDLQNTMAS